MVYLIDDNQNNLRQKKYNITFIEDGVFNGYLAAFEKIERGKGFSDMSHLEFLKNADCILLHSTTEDFDKDKGFITGSNTNVIKIKELISDEGDIVPLVMFSNSMGEPEFDFESNPNYIRSIKKNLFYERFFDFLEYYKETGKIELRIIAWGKNFMIKDVSTLALEIVKAIEQKKNSDDLILSDLSNVLKSFNTFVELAFPKNNLNDILEDIEDNPIKISFFKKKINQITESFTKHGKNIYTWK